MIRQCYTCGLIGQSGCCAVCATKCHKGHAMSDWKQASPGFYCDCGAGSSSWVLFLDVLDE